jgi:hypothetical protein
MEIIALSIMIVILITVFTVDARQKRRAFINEHKQEQ